MPRYWEACITQAAGSPQVNSLRINNPSEDVAAAARSRWYATYQRRSGDERRGGYERGWVGVEIAALLFCAVCCAEADWPQRGGGVQWQRKAETSGGVGHMLRPVAAEPGLLICRSTLSLSKAAMENKEEGFCNNLRTICDILIISHWRKRRERKIPHPKKTLLDELQWHQPESVGQAHAHKDVFLCLFKMYTFGGTRLVFLSILIKSQRCIWATEETNKQNRLRGCIFKYKTQISVLKVANILESQIYDKPNEKLFKNYFPREKCSLTRYSNAEQATN